MSKEIWLSDANGNRCSVGYWGSRVAAQALADMKRLAEAAP